MSDKNFVYYFVIFPLIFVLLRNILNLFSVILSKYFVASKFESMIDKIFYFWRYYIVFTLFFLFIPMFFYCLQFYIYCLLPDDDFLVMRNILGFDRSSSILQILNLSNFIELELFSSIGCLSVFLLILSSLPMVYYAVTLKQSTKLVSLLIMVLLSICVVYFDIYNVILWVILLFNFVTYCFWLANYSEGGII